MKNIKWIQLNYDVEILREACGYQGYICQYQLHKSKRYMYQGVVYRNDAADDFLKWKNGEYQSTPYGISLLVGSQRTVEEDSEHFAFTRLGSKDELEGFRFKFNESENFSYIGYARKANWEDKTWINHRTQTGAISVVAYIGPPDYREDISWDEQMGLVNSFLRNTSKINLEIYESIQIFGTAALYKIYDRVYDRENYAIAKKRYHAIISPTSAK